MKVLKNLNMFDGIHDDLIRNVAIIIDDEKIEAIFPENQQDFPDAEVIDMEGAYAAPGFIDCHLHFTLDEIPDKERLLNYQSAGGVVYDNIDAYRALRAAEFARVTLEAGFTSVVDGGGVNYVDVALKDAIALRYIPGPDTYVCGKQIIAWPSSHFPDLGAQAYGADMMRKAVRDQIYYGVDQIKIENSAPLRSVGRSLAKSSFTVEEMRAAVEEAHSMNLPVQVHARGAKAVETALLGGADMICHGTGMTENEIDLMVKNGTFLLPTLASPDREPDAHVVAAKSSRVVEILRQTGTIQWESMKMAYRAGVRIALSTDSGGVGVKHGQNAKEFLRMKEIGMSSVQCLRAGTSEAAKCMHKEDIGILEKGKKADIVFMKENPLEDLSATTRVKAVMKNGCFVKKCMTE